MAFDEEQTRRYIIDQMLADEGWNVGNGMTSTAEVIKEAAIKYQLGSSGEGKADYVLEDDNGKPLSEGYDRPLQ
jgi:type I restriction enzyme R subunit